MKLSQLPTALAKRCRSSCSTIRIAGQRTEQSSAFSSLAKLVLDDDDENVTSINVINDSINREKNTFRSTAKHLESSVQRLNVMNRVAKNGILQTVKVKKHMPRLDELRSRLAKSNHEEDTKIFSLRSSSKVGGGSSNSSTKAKSDNDMTWREVLAAAKEHLSKNISQDEMLLTDAYSRKHSYLRISLGERCNLRCLYCMPPEGVPLQPSEKILNAYEISRLVQLFTSRGVDKVSLYVWYLFGTVSSRKLYVDGIHFFMVPFLNNLFIFYHKYHHQRFG